MAVDTTERGAETGRARRRWPLLVAAAVVGALVAFTAVWALPSVDQGSGGGSGQSGPEQAVLAQVESLDLSPQERAAHLAEIAAYLEELKPLTEELGFLVVHGLRAGVNDIPAERFDEETLRGMPRSWRNMLRELEPRFAAVTPPEPLRESHEGLIATFDGYVEVTELLSQAVEEDGERRRDLARRAAMLGEDTDREWNLAAYGIQMRLLALGEEPVIWLPDPRDNPDSDDYVDGDPDEWRKDEFLPRD